MRYRTCRTARSRSGRSRRVGKPNGTADALMRCLARLMRCAIVASGTRKARAISAVRQPADRAQRQRNRGRRRQRRMTTHEEERQRVVTIERAEYADARAELDAHGRRRLDGLVTARGSVSFAAAARGFAAHVIGHAPRRHVNQPAARIVRQTIARPLQRPRRAALPARRPRRPRSRETAARSRRAPAAPARAAAARLPRRACLSQQIFGRSAHHLPDLDRHVQRAPTRTRRRRRTRRDLVGAIG